MHVFSKWIAAALCIGFVSAASAQVFYEPVQYQHHFAGSTFYYGGHNPRVFAAAAGDILSRDYSSVTHAIHVMRGSEAYTDAAVLDNAGDSTYTGYSRFTANDARNEAYASVPRYFKKANLLAAAELTEDGTWIVPAHAQPRIEIRIVRPFASGESPAVGKGMILIIPKKFLEKKSRDAADHSVALAQP
jgi:hypothetical protein